MTGRPFLNCISMDESFLIILLSAKTSELFHFSTYESTDTPKFNILCVCFSSIQFYTYYYLGIRYASTIKLANDRK